MGRWQTLALVRRRTAADRCGRVHRSQWDVRRVDRHHYGLIGRSSPWVLPAVERTIKGSDRHGCLERFDRCLTFFCLRLRLHIARE
eukprot:scaffold33315_cov112-Isochrysis_galbana.AAC.2